MTAKGFTVLFGLRNIERGEAAAREVGPDAVALQLDVTDRASIAVAADRVCKEFGSLDVLIRNAAISTTGDVDSPEDYVEVEPPSTRCAPSRTPTCSACCQSMVQNGGHAEFPDCQRLKWRGVADAEFGAESPLRPSFNASYPASQAALNALTVATAIELEPDGIKVNAVSPGYI